MKSQEYMNHPFPLFLLFLFNNFTTKIRSIQIYVSPENHHGNLNALIKSKLSQWFHRKQKKKNTNKMSEYLEPDFEFIANQKRKNIPNSTRIFR